MNDQTTRISGPSAAVAVSIVVLLGAVLVAAILKYDTVDEALQLSTSLSALFGVVTGAFVSYFFTRGTTSAAQAAVTAAQASADKAVAAATEVSEASKGLVKQTGATMAEMLGGAVRSSRQLQARVDALVEQNTQLREKLAHQPPS